MTLILATSAAVPAPRHSGAEVLRDLKKVSVLGSVLYVAAHPDDENTRLLATLANETQVRAAYLAFTRGEGGQNLIGQELGPLLGMIRTQELLAARRLDGAEQYFTRSRDFGFSKSVDETLRIWDHDAVLGDAVYVIRTLRPDVIITRFPQEASDTHGHHTASARLALEAFKVAADATKYPGTPPWQAKRIVWNAWSPDPSVKLDLSHAVTMDSSVYSALLGYTYGELAGDSRSMHKSQGFGAAPVHGPSPENFVPLAGTAAAKSLFDGIDLTWARVPGSQDIAKLLKQATDGFRADKPQASIPVLLQALEAMRKLRDHPWKQQKIDELSGVIADCAGLFAEAAASTFGTVPGASLDVALTVLNRSDARLTLAAVKTSDGQTSEPKAALDNGKAFTSKIALKVAGNAPLSSPAWLVSPPNLGTWNVPSPAVATTPEAPAPLWAELTLTTADGHSFVVRRSVAYKWTDPTAGERFRPIEILPPVLVKPDASVLVFSDTAKKALKVSLTANADGQTGTVTAEAPAGWTLTPASAPFTLTKRGDSTEVVFQLQPNGALAKGTTQQDTLKVRAHVGGEELSLGLTRIDYAHIPMQTLLSPADVKLVRFELAKGKPHLGYIVGAGDEVPQALRQVGYDVTLLDDEALRSKPLSGFDAIVVGIRAFNTNPRMPAYHAKLMDYVNGGGTLLVQYNTKNRVSDVPPDIGPFPFDISHDRVTDENAEVGFELPNHPLFAKPNAIGPEDFEGWVQERGLYFAGTWDKRYETPMSMHDPGETPKKGAVLIAKSGKGTFIYTGLAFFRELPAGVPGAYRLFANLLANGH